MQLRHYPVTVSASRARTASEHAYKGSHWDSDPGKVVPQARLGRKSGDRPALYGFIQLLGRAEEHIREPGLSAFRLITAYALASILTPVHTGLGTGTGSRAFMQAAASAQTNPVTLILGGARSGKSRYAQTLATQRGQVVFIATATPVDEEMGAKIARHRLDRVEDRLAHWKVVEEPLALAVAIREHGSSADLILIDCLTLYVAALLALEDEAQSENLSQLYTQVKVPPCPLALVSNEVGSGVVPEYISGRRYRDLLGEVNQRIAALATDVLLMVAGLPLTLKRNGTPA